MCTVDDEDEEMPSESNESNEQSSQMLNDQPEEQLSSGYPEQSSPSSVNDDQPLSSPFNDIGKLLSPSKSVESICHVITQLDNNTKYSLLYDHLQPPSILPYSTIRGSNRKFNISWLSKYPWLKYSPMLDGVFCGPCSLLLCSSERRDKGILVNKAFNNWSKLFESFNS